MSNQPRENGSGLTGTISLNRVLESLVCHAYCDALLVMCIASIKALSASRKNSQDLLTPIEHVNLTVKSQRQ
jgi:hypothetical protein